MHTGIQPYLFKKYKQVFFELVDLHKCSPNDMTQINVVKIISIIHPTESAHLLTPITPVAKPK